MKNQCSQVVAIHRGIGNQENSGIKKTSLSLAVIRHKIVGIPASTHVAVAMEAKKAYNAIFRGKIDLKLITDS